MGKGWTDTGYFTIVSNHVLEDSELTARSRFIYTLLVRYGRWKKVGNERYLVAWVSRPKLAELTGESEWSVSKRIRELVDRGLIERSRRPGGSTVTYICDPRPIYAQPLDIPEDAPAESPDDGDSLEILDQEPDSPSLAGSHVIVGSSTPRDGLEHTTGTDGITQGMPVSAPNRQSTKSDKDVAVEKDITILSDNSRASPGSTGRTENGTADEEAAGPPLGERRVRKNRLVGLLARRAEMKLTSRSKSKIGVPAEDVPIDADPQTAREVWNEFQRRVLTTHPGIAPVEPTRQEIGNCRKLLEEHGVEDILGLFDMVVDRWAVVMEKWPRVAKTPTPTFYAAFTLRRELIPLVQTGKGLTSRTHRVDPSAKVPEIGWGDE